MKQRLKQQKAQVAHDAQGRTVTRKVATYCYQCVAGPDLPTVRDGVATEVEPNFAAADVHPAAARFASKPTGWCRRPTTRSVLQPMKRTNPRKGRDEDPGFVRSRGKKLFLLQIS